MTQAAFNTYRFLETLGHSVEFSPAQVKDLAKALDTSQTDADLVTNAELRAGLAEVRTEIADLRSETRTEFAKVRAEIADLRTELKGEIAELRGELRSEVAKLETKIAASANKMILWVVGINFALYGGMFAIMAKGFHWY